MYCQFTVSDEKQQFSGLFWHIGRRTLKRTHIKSSKISYICGFSGKRKTQHIPQQEHLRKSKCVVYPGKLGKKQKSVQKVSLFGL